MHVLYFLNMELFDALSKLPMLSILTSWYLFAGNCVPFPQQHFSARAAQEKGT